MDKNKKTTKKNISPKAPVGRPSDYSREMADKICARIEAGDSLRTISAYDDMPSVVTIFTWMRVHEEFLKQYQRAKEAQVDALYEEMLDIADDGSNDYVEKEGKFGTYTQLDSECVNRSKLRVHTRQWMCERLKPKRYGPRQAIEHMGKDGEPIEIKDVSTLPTDEIIKQLHTRLTNG